MYFPIEFNFGAFTVSLHMILEIAAFFIGYRYYSFLKKRKGDSIESLNRVWILVGAALGALVFSRLLGSLENPNRFFSGKEDFLYYYENKTIIGGLLGGVLGVELMKKVIGEIRSSGDLFTYPLILAMIIGRIGCFSMGVHEATFGNETSFFMGMDLGDGVFRHPTAIYEIIVLVVLWILLVILEKHFTLKSGILFKIFMLGVLLYRFCIEWIRPGESVLIGLNVIQLACLLGLIYYIPNVLSPKKIIANEKRK